MKFLMLCFYRKPCYFHMNYLCYLPSIQNLKVSVLVMYSGIITGRPFGGVAILIRKKLRQYCNFIFYDDPRRTRLEIKCVLYTASVHLLNVYLSDLCHDNYDDYLRVLR